MAQSVSEFWHEIRQQIREGKRAALESGATLLYTATLQELAAGSPGHGRRYKRGRRYHRASKKGAAPARDTGTLQRAIGYVIDDTTATVGIKNTAPYAKFLDPPRGQREPLIGRRPFLSSAFSKNEQKIRDEMRKELERHMRRIGR